jgi:hypothetical protein
VARGDFSSGPAQKAEELHVADLARVFPVLEQLAAMRKLLSQAPVRDEAVQERANAERALLELLRRVASRQMVVLFIDDLQWGDLDSVRILRSWLEAEETLPLLLVLSYRSDEQATNACLQHLTADDQPRSAQELVIEVSPLPRPAIEAMCVAQGELPESWVERIASDVDQRRAQLDGTPQHRLGRFAVWRLAPHTLARNAHGAKAKTTHRQLACNLELESFTGRG